MKQLFIQSMNIRRRREPAKRCKNTARPMPASSCIGAHTDARRVDHRQEHFLTALVVLGAVIA